MPEVSIVLPTYNRADVLPRAIDSVLAQTFTDWELIIVDDGSTDDTASVVERGDPRIRFVRQANGGCYVARNHGLRVSTGKWITFLDSDDEWLPHYLALSTGFLAASPEDQFVMSEFWADYGSGVREREDRSLIGQKWPALAREIGSRSLDLPAGESDDYLRVYSSREPLGPWGRAIAERAGHPDAMLYRGRIFEHFRWGHLGWLPTTMLTRGALEKVGLFAEDYRTAADYRFLASLCRFYRANLIGVPGASKHHQAAGNRPLAEGHLATGVHEYRYAVHRIPLFDGLFGEAARTDPELGRIRGLYLLYAGRTALALGKRPEAIAHLREAVAAVPDYGQARRLLAVARCLPAGPLGQSIYRKGRRLVEVVGSVFSPPPKTDS